ncbi:hypothetical protein OG589_17105 [Sphaerisporangium sp. NBC_01403]|uniref:hypothetical protein n=1 Tax=Sphaerisporangium sp. NBC_01403 TaxID=2903599 RepID=UPI003255E416
MLNISPKRLANCASDFDMDQAWRTPNVLLSIVRDVEEIRSVRVRAVLADELGRLDVDSRSGKKADEMRAQLARIEPPPFTFSAQPRSARYETRRHAGRVAHAVTDRQCKARDTGHIDTSLVIWGAGNLMPQIP